MSYEDFDGVCGGVFGADVQLYGEGVGEVEGDGEFFEGLGPERTPVQSFSICGMQELLDFDQTEAAGSVKGLRNGDVEKDHVGGLNVNGDS